MFTGGVAGEELADDGCRSRVDDFGVLGTLLSVSEGRRQRIEPLLQVADEALPDLLAEIPDVVSCDDRLDVGRKPGASRIEAQIVVREPNIDALIDEVADLGPVPEIASATVNLVDDEPVRTAPQQLFHHVAELRATRP